MEKTRQEHVQEIAYFMWLNRGKPDGKDLEIWTEAERIYEITQSGFTSKVSLTKSTTENKQSKTISKLKKSEIKSSKPKVSKKEKPKSVEVGKIIPMIRQKLVEKPKLKTSKKKIKIVLHKK